MCVCVCVCVCVHLCVHSQAARYIMICAYSLQESYHFREGSTNGVFQGKQYFICSEDNALFVSLDRLSEHPARPQIEMAQIETAAATVAAATALPPTGGQLYPPKPAQQDETRKQKAPLEAKVGRIPPPSFKVGDRVVFFKEDGTPVSGTVRWAGIMNNQEGKKSFSFNAVGIETVSHVYFCWCGRHNSFSSISGCKGVVY